MNSLQQELDNINQQLEHLNARKNQLEPIIAEYSDVINRVKNLVSNMIDVNVEPSNLMFDIQDLVNLEDEPDTTPELTPEPQPGQDFPTAIEWEKIAPHAYYHSELRLVKLIVPWVNIETLGEVDEICNKICHQAELANSYEIKEYGDNWAIYLSVEGYSPDDVDSMIAAFFPESEPELTPEPTPQPVKMFAFVPGFPVPTPALTQEPTPEPTPEPQPEPVQINMQAYRRGDDVLIIGFTNKRLMNTWSKWFKSSWGDQVHISTYSDNLEGFNHTLTVLWYGKRIDWERLTKLNYSLKPTEQNHIAEAYYQQVSQVANSEEE